MLKGAKKMAKIGLFYGSTTGNTEIVAGLIKEALDESKTNMVVVLNVAEASIEDMKGFDYLILGTPTWYDGELQDDWNEFLPNLDELDLSAKKGAVFGLGDQDGYSDTFVDGLGILANKIKERGCQLVGTWPLEGYEFDASRAVEGDKFMGLVIDVDNQDELTSERVKTWVNQIQGEFGL
jgi:flavodoxin I